MNPDSPLTPREETEMRLTALLMGELSSEEAAALRQQMAGDAELTTLHARLGRAMELLREASAIPEPAAPPVPLRLSDNRRERLLAHFKGPAPQRSATIVKPKRDWKSVVPLSLAAALIALLGGAVLINAMFHGTVLDRRWPRQSHAKAGELVQCFPRRHHFGGSE